MQKRETVSALYQRLTVSLSSAVRTGPESISQTLIYLAIIGTCYLIVAN